MTQLSNTGLNISHKVLSIQINLNGLSFCILNTQSNTITDLKVFSKSKRQTPEDTLDALKHVFNTETVLSQNFSKLIVVHVNELSALVPKPMFNEDAIADYLKLNTKIFKTDFITHDEIAINDSVNVYVPYINVNNFIHDQFGDFTYKHYSTILIETLLAAEKNNKAPKLYANINASHFELIAIENGKLTLYNSFNYVTEQDFIYYVLFTIEQLGLNPETLSFVFLGAVTKNDNLFNIAYKYIREVSIGTNNTLYNFTTEPIANHNHFTLLNSF